MSKSRRGEVLRNIALVSQILFIMQVCFTIKIDLTNRSAFFETERVTDRSNFFTNTILATFF
ncbi:hypothetical protein LI82_00985 [Methanococcoides methylutens]|uniref:Uncharacterized protein n=1 Tax=Methanococcoides methylutens TaxID=2226 RepID=A0A099T4K4_METMT|nr:hypothetical protein LI82_00985 [Methanococcoides methylutens]